MKRIFLFAVSLLSCMTMRAPQTGFLNRSMTIGATIYPYSVYVPKDYEPGRRLPVILFLHGAGERGRDGLRPTQVGIGSAIRFNPERANAIVVFPQAPDETRWLGEPADFAMAALDASLREFNGDRDRVALTGLSMGGYGTWHLALAHGDRFAAIAVICGGLLPHDSAASVRQSPLTMQSGDPYSFVAHALREKRIWIIHGSEDRVIPVTESRRMAEALRAEGAAVKYTEYEGVGHNAWDRAYGEAELWAFLLLRETHGR